MDCSTAATSPRRRSIGWSWWIRSARRCKRAHRPERAGRLRRWVIGWRRVCKGTRGHVSDHESGARARVKLIDIAARVPGLLADTPSILRGATGLLARPSSKVSIGSVFQDRAARYADRIFLKFGDEQLTYREANAIANRYAAVLAARGVGPGDVVGVMLRNSPNAVVT